MYDIVALGELLIDFAAVSSDCDGYPVMAAHPGGAPANFLAAASRCGGKTAMIGKVGNDAFGHLLLGTLRANSIDTMGMKISDEVFTTLAFVTFDEHGERSFSFSRKPGADTQLCYEEVNLELIDNSRVFHFGSLSLTQEPCRSAARQAVAYAKQKGKLISYDPNLRKPLWESMEEAKKQILWGLSMADIVKNSDDEIDFLFGMSPEQGTKYILEHFGVSLVFATCGANGCVYGNRSVCGYVPALSGLKVLDTCGAGDIFGGSAVQCVLNTGKTPNELNSAELRQIAGFATAAAGLSTERSGGISSIPSLDEIRQRMREC